MAYQVQLTRSMLLLENAVNAFLPKGLVGQVHMLVPGSRRIRVHFLNAFVEDKQGKIEENGFMVVDCLPEDLEDFAELGG